MIAAEKYEGNANYMCVFVRFSEFVYKFDHSLIMHAGKYKFPSACLMKEN